MKKYFLSLFLVFFILVSGFLASAACSLGASPLDYNIKAKPGQTLELKWNFYNLYGEKTTHVSVSKLSGEDWIINYYPELHTAEYNIGGEIKTIEENLFLEKKEMVSEIPDNVPEGEVYLKHQEQNKYVPAKELKIYITIPGNFDTEKNFVFEAAGKCFDEGEVVPGINSQLKVKITSTEYYEKSLGEMNIIEKLGREILGIVMEPSKIKSPHAFGTGIAAILLVSFVFLLLILKRKRK